MVDFFTAVNGFEIVWWSLCAAICFQRARGKWRRLGRMAAILFLMFAMTDVTELQTGAWWRPWWLAGVKGICLMGLVSCGLWGWRKLRKV